MLALTVNTAGLLPVIKRADALAYKTARLAGSSGVRAMRAEASRQIRDRWNIKAARVNKALSTVFPRSGSELVWKVRSSYGPTPLADFGARQTKRGVTVVIRKGGSRTLIPGAFLATMKSGHVGVFTRVGKARLPIQERFGPKISNAFKDAAPAIAERGRAVFFATFERLLRRA